MRKSSLRLAVFCSIGAVLLGGCTQSALDVGAEGSSLTIWVDAELRETAETLAEQYAEDTGGTLKVVEKNFYDIESELSSGAPDIFIGSTEWTDRLASSGLITQATAQYPNGFEQRVLQGASYQGLLFGIPYAVESLALVCNGGKVDRQPESLSELTVAGYSIIVTPGGDPYTLFPIQSSFEVYPLILDEAGDWIEQSGLGSDRSKEFATWLGESRSLLKPLDYSAGISAFVDGRESCLLTGPWAISEILNRAEFPIAVYDFPSVGGSQPLSFATARAVFVSANTPYTEQASKVASYFANPATQLLIYKQTGRVPAMAAVVDEIPDPVVKGFAKAAASSVVLPNSPLMQKTWAPWSKALNMIITSDEDPQITWDLMVQDLAKVSG